MGAIQFVEGLDQTSLTISPEEFEQHVEAAVSTIAEKHPEEAPAPAPASPVVHPPLISEKSSISRPEVNARNSLEGEYSTSRRPTSPRRSSDLVTGVEDEKAAVAGLLRTIQRPLSSIGRIFSDADTSAQAQRSAALVPPSSSAHHPVATPQPGRSPRLTPGGGSAVATPRSSSAKEGSRPLRAEDAAARQASAETAEAQRIQSAEHADVVETLSGMFPDLDKDVIDDVVRMKEGRVGLAVDACLALSS
jgi:hypothetical protein